VIIGVHWVRLRIATPSERMVILKRCETLCFQHAAATEHAPLKLVEGELIWLPAARARTSPEPSPGTLTCICKVRSRRTHAALDQVLSM
jgi:hypothetical protein